MTFRFLKKNKKNKKIFWKLYIRTTEEFNGFSETTIEFDKYKDVIKFISKYEEGQISGEWVDFISIESLWKNEW